MKVIPSNVIYLVRQKFLLSLFTTVRLQHAMVKVAGVDLLSYIDRVLSCPRTFNTPRVILIVKQTGFSWRDTASGKYQFTSVVFTQ